MNSPMRLCAASLVLFAIGCGQQNTEIDTASVDKELAEIADTMNRSLPIQFDAITRLDSMTAVPNRRLMYKYSIVNTVRPLSSEKLIQEMRPVTLNQYKTAKEMADLRRMKVTLVYRYDDEQGNEIARFEIGPQDIE